MKIKDNLHLTYCSNIHPGETWDEVKQNLETYLPGLKQNLSPTDAFGVGLRLSEQAARELLIGERLDQLRAWFDQEDLYVFTINGFPYGGFHNQRVKDDVYAPDWSKQERYDYTLKLVKILSTLLPEGIDGGISTVPLSYKPWWIDDKAAGDEVFATSTRYLARLTSELVALRQHQGQLIHIDLEPEPDGLIENAAEMVAYFEQWLLPVGGQWLAKALAISQTEAEQHLKDHVQVCYDTCHFAVEYEQPQQVFEQFRKAGIKVGKGQLSAALRIEIPEDAAKKVWLADQLEPFAESTYLHQVIERGADGGLRRYEDLQQVLADFTKTQAKEWRTHFHVPIFVDRYQAFQSTQTDITAFLQALPNIPECSHLEIETYTWDVLPPDMKLDIAMSIQREYEWVLSSLKECELMLPELGVCA